MSAQASITVTENALPNKLLKGVLLQHIVRYIHVKESRDNMDPLVTQIQYDRYSWHVYRDLREIEHRLALQLDYIISI